MPSFLTKEAYCAHVILVISWKRSGVDELFYSPQPIQLSQNFSTIRYNLQGFDLLMYLI